ncbi:MAG: alpha/beta hydrolase [Planctomycetota bacterium]
MRLLLPLALALALAAPALAAPEHVSFATADGWTIHADLAPAKEAGAPVAVLLHQYRADRSTWAPLLERLAAAGVHALALDQRAHGESTRKGEETVRVQAIEREAFAALVRDGHRDVEAALAFLRGRGIGAKRVVLVGASYGCSVSVLASAGLPEVQALVLLSPGAGYFGVDVTKALARFRHPSLIVVAKGDGCFGDLPKLLESRPETPGRCHLVVAGKQHGTRLFGAAQQVEAVGNEGGGSFVLPARGERVELPALLVRWVQAACAAPPTK